MPGYGSVVMCHLVHVRRHCMDGPSPYVPTRGNKMNKEFKKNQKTKASSKTTVNTSEDELLASSQETVVSLQGTGYTNQSSPVPHQSKIMASQPKLVTSPGDQPKRKRKHKSSGEVWKSRVCRAKFMLAKIAKNAQDGTVHERDAEDAKKYQAVVDEYLKYKDTLPSTSQDTQRAKRNRSHNESDKAPKRIKVNEQKTVSQPVSTTRRPFNEVVKDHLLVALANVSGGSPLPVVKEWSAIESKLSELVVKHLLGNKEGVVPRFDSGEIHRGFRLIRCLDVFSKEFLGNCIATISDAWEGLTLKLIPASEIPFRPRARIWLPKMELDGHKLLEGLRLQNQNVPMDDWSVIRVEEPKNNSMSLVLAISEQGVVALEKLDNKLFFGIREAKVKVFRPNGSNDVDEADQLLNNLQLEEPPNMTDDGEAEGRAD